MKQVLFYSKALHTLCSPFHLINRFSIFRFLLLFFVFSGLGEVKGQNVINIYQDFEGQPVNPIANLGQYNGEYQIKTPLLHWIDIPGYWYGDPFGSNYTFKRKTELVSYPFYPDFEASGSSQRIFTVLSDEVYNSDHNFWSDPNWNPIRPDVVSISTHEEQTLVSELFDQKDPVSGAGEFIPHSIFNHVIYLECGLNSNYFIDYEDVIDFVNFPIDLTRSKMRDYPFTTSNDIPTSASHHDVTILPFFELPTDFNATANNLNTLNYFPANEVLPTECQEASLYFYPNIGDAINNNNTNPNQYFHPAPFSLLGFHLNNATGTHPVGYKHGTNNLLEPRDGITHQYYIDKNIDLTKINTTEKIIYNPSEVHITADNLVFPSGYTFKTVRGLYPTVDEIENTTICDAADELDDQRLIHVETDLQTNVSFTTSEGIDLTAPAFYILEPGSKLTIEPCVSIFDVTFLVRTGAELIFHPNQTYGNFRILEEQADVENLPDKIIEINLPNKTCNDCRCVQEYDIAQDLVVDNGEILIWMTDKTVRSNITIKSGGELQVRQAKVEFTDVDVTDNVIFTGITVEAGGKLLLDDAHLTILDGEQPNNCARRHQSWGGIRLRGLNPKAVGEQAELQATNSTISFAKKAIDTQGFTHNDFGQSNWQSGGHVSARNIIFNNNGIGLFAMGKNHLNTFVGCTFTLSPSLRNNFVLENFLSHAFLFNEQNVSFENCAFDNEFSEGLFIEDRGTGIIAYDSDLEVFTDPPPYPFPAPLHNESSFKNLYKGIEHYAFTEANMKVIGVEFENTLQCITANSSNGDNIRNNHFTLNVSGRFTDEERVNTNSILDIYDSWAIYMFGAKNYDITANTVDFNNFDEGSTPHFLPTLYGFIINNTAGGTGSIVENILNQNQSGSLGSVIGTQTEENNKSVEISCNTYNNFSGLQEWEINPISSSDQPFPNLLKDQGSGCGTDPQTGTPLPAGNLFQNNCGNTEANIRVGFLESGFNYWANGLPGSEAYPDCSSSVGVVINNCFPLNQNILCPNGNSGSGGGGKVLVNSYSPTGIVKKLNDGSYNETKKILLSTAVYKAYEEAEQESDALVFLEAMNTNHTNSILLKKYLKKGLVTNAQRKINALRGGENYNASYIQFYQLLIDVQTSGRKYTDMTTHELQIVEKIAQSRTYGSVYAESLLAMLNQTTYDRIPHKKDNQRNKKTNSNDLVSSIQIYPNPSEGLITVESLIKDAKLLVYNITGQLIREEALDFGKNQMEMNVPNGTYFFKILSKEQIISHKIIIAQ